MVTRLRRKMDAVAKTGFSFHFTLLWVPCLVSHFLCNLVYTYTNTYVDVYTYIVYILHIFLNAA